jgi:hypothetical protein
MTNDWKRKTKRIRSQTKDEDKPKEIEVKPKVEEVKPNEVEVKPIKEKKILKELYTEKSHQVIQTMPMRLRL